MAAGHHPGASQVLLPLDPKEKTFSGTISPGSLLQLFCSWLRTGSEGAHQDVQWECLLHIRI